MGFSSFSEWAQYLSDDYYNMIISVSNNYGFYVGRYELTGSIENPKEKSDAPLVDLNWYEHYNVCKKFSVNGIVESSMIW